MICKKCQTATPNEEKNCIHCGSATKQKTWKKVVLFFVLVLSVAALVTAFFLVDKKLLADEKEIKELIAEEEKELEEEEFEEEIDQITYKDPMEEVWKELDLWFDALTMFLKTKNTPYLISRNGFLYDYENDVFIQPEEVLESYQDDSDKIYFLKLNKSHLAMFEECEITGSGENFFVATEIMEGMALVTNEQKVILYRENFNRVLEEYKTHISDIIRPTEDERVYAEIKTLLQENEVEEKEAVIRYLSYDDNYAFVAYAYTEESEVRYAVLEKEFTQGLDQEEERSFKQKTPELMDIEGNNKKELFLEIYDKIPLFNDGLLPETAYIREVPVLIENEAIQNIIEKKYPLDPEDVFTYLSFDKHIFYVETMLGRKFIGYKDTEGWQMEEASSSLEAENVLAIQYPLGSIFHIKQ